MKSSLSMERLIHRAWAEIDLDAIAHNVAEIKRLVGRRTEIMAVVKADAYGHGVRETVSTMIDSGVTRIAVSMLDEALQLRELGIEVPILVLGHSDPKRALEIIRHSVTQTVFSHDLAGALSEAAVREGKPAKVHVKIDTGMSRVGFLPGYSAVKSVVLISQLPGLIIEGIFTHFASADEADTTFTRQQFEMFESILSELNRIGVFIPIKHVSNSAAVLAFPDMTLDMVRPGIILYGILPGNELRIDTKNEKPPSFRPAMTLKAQVILVKEISEGTTVSYGRKWRASRASKIATLPIGYADGYTRNFSNRARVLINGQYAPVIGSICMDQCMIDVTDINSCVKTGDEVVLIGKQGGLNIAVEELADLAGTISYETLCLIGKRIPRVYRRDGLVVSVHNSLI